ncbi:DUF2142 domain-containing protein [Methanobrevibacter millerae]|uniref:Uncharacterized membrane protein n=1 Tax=Methanobrevibacter millerae TaxID=230361 RepID=A0A1G5WCV4_9EURY|nr:DUF2142 domain-containing protein [Methanobrevibacter millerae]SDA55903.1 Uncharacterized membrane protein [Methanobrevibacter millerae]
MNRLMEDFADKQNRNYFLAFIILTIFATLCLFTQDNYASPLKEIIILFVTLIFGIISIASYVKERKIHKTAVIIIILFGMMCVFLSPICSVSDELEHFTRSEITTQGVLFPEYITQDNISGFKTIESTSNTEPRDHTIFETDWDTQKINFTEVLSNSAFQQNPFYVYIAQAIGIELAKILNINNISLLWFARICNLLLYAGLCGIAIKQTPMLKMPMAVIACFPLSIIQAASCSSDAFIFSFTLVVIAYLAHMYKSKDASLTKKHILIYTVMVVVLGLTKVTLGALILLLVIIPKSKFKTPSDYYSILISIVIVLLSLLAWSKFYAVDGITHSWRRELFKIKHVNSTEQISYLMSNPQAIVTFARIGDQLPTQIYALTRFYSEYPTSALLNYVYFIFAMLFALFYPIKENLSKNKRLIIGFIIAIIILGTYIVQYLTWAPVGSINLLDAGVVPRYFLPVLVLIPLIFNVNNKNFKNQELTIITCITIFLSSAIMFIATMLY